MNLKYISQYIVITALFITIQIVGSDAFNFDQLDSFQNNLFDQLDLSQTTSEENKSLPDAFDNLVTNITEGDLTHMRSSCPTGEASLILGLANGLNLPNLLNPSIYFKTLVPQSRNILSLPNTQLVTYQFLPKQQLTTHLFINVTPRKNFRNSQDCIAGTHLGSYLNIKTNALINALDQAIELISDDDLKVRLQHVDTNKLLWAFEQAKLEERRLGVFFHYYRQMSEKSYFQVKLPVYWLIRNLNYDQQFKDIIQQ
jgi:hypothetical protein